MEALDLGKEENTSSANIATVADNSVDTLLPKTQRITILEDNVQDEDEDDEHEENSTRTAKPPATSPTVVAPSQTSELRKCTYCNAPETASTKFLICGKCKKENISIPYCSRDCQLQDWQAGHKQRCGVK
jgi:hypothetical protein